MANPKPLPCDELAIRTRASVPACAAARYWVLAVAVLGSTLAYVDESVVNVALPAMEALAIAQRADQAAATPARAGRDQAGRDERASKS